MQSAGSAKCPKGQIRKKSYIRRSKKNSKKSSKIKVKSACIKHVGKRASLKGKTPKSAKVLPKLKKGELAQFGYSTKYTSSERHSALDKAVKNNTALSTLRHLVVARSYNRYTNPDIYKKMDKDVKYLQKKYFKSI